MFTIYSVKLEQKPLSPAYMLEIFLMTPTLSLHHTHPTHPQFV